MLRNLVFNDWFTVFFVICLGLLATAKFIYSKRFNESLTVLINSNYHKIYIKEQSFINLFDGLLFGNLVISLVVFFHIILSVFYGYDQSVDFQLYYKLFIIIGAIILIKVFIDRLVGSLFDIDELMNIYVFQKITFKNLIGIILLPINILLIFTINPSKSIIFIIISLVFILNIIGFLTTVTNHLKAIKSNLFYFILYLCALEIGPYVILYKVLNSY